ncbi:LytTR family DNA-binding domain-containing protein [Thalassobius sp. I31.1]|uniref:LytTR family DNA-binding domain-containing protein n=1 Tax=Thalassobius sp. I31.1 TaxID=2109912 RepID=UPI000D19D135|nr:LytTR family DNA-binding domain-containing protein [Thalassobius sp. I31.1]
MTDRIQLPEVNWGAKAIVILSAIAVLTATGPFGTYQILDFTPRLLYWAGAVMGVGLIMNLMALFSLHLKIVQRSSWFMRVVAWVLIGAVPGSFLMLALGVVFLDHEGVFSYPFHRMYFKICVISTMICIVDLRGMAFWAGDKGNATPVDDAPSQAADKNELRQFLNQLRHEVGDDVISISTQDHYLDVTTTQGSDLIHGKLSAAAEQLASLPGVRLHRSHWAAVGHIQRLKRKDSGHIVCLSDGRELPVSRSQLPAVRAALGLS